jgi:transposase
MDGSLITDSEWKKIYSFLNSLNKHIHIKNELKTKKFVSAVLYILRSGCQWRFLPRSLGNWRSVHKRFFEWVNKEIFDEMLEFFSKDKDDDCFLVDALTTRAHILAQVVMKKVKMSENVLEEAGEDLQPRFML